MPIGTTAALLGSAVIGAGASAMGASANSKAINSAAAAQQQATAEQTALTRDIYNQNKTMMAPYVSRGNVAGDTINALLGIGGTQGTAATPDYTAYVNANPDILQEWNTKVAGTGAFGSLADYGKFHYGTYGQGEGRQLPTSGGTLGTSAVEAARNAFDQYRNSTGYQFRYNEGMKGLNAGYAGRGLLQSGAAQKAAIRYGQDYGSNEFANYLGYLGNQQGVGLSGASALAGVGQNFANSMNGISQNGANAVASAAAARANNTNSLVSGLSSSLGGGLGALSSYGGGAAPSVFNGAGSFYNPSTMF